MLIKLSVRINKSTYLRVIVSALQIVESCLGIVDIPTVAEGVNICKVGVAGYRFVIAVIDRELAAPCVVVIVGDNIYYPYPLSA